MGKIFYAKNCNHSNRYFREVLIKNQETNELVIDYQCHKCRLDELKKDYEMKRLLEIFNELDKVYDND